MEAESDTCLVVVTVFKTVAPTLRAGWWVRFPPSPPSSLAPLARWRLGWSSRLKRRRLGRSSRLKRRASRAAIGTDSRRHLRSLRLLDGGSVVVGQTVSRLRLAASQSDSGLGTTCRAAAPSAAARVVIPFEAPSFARRYRHRFPPPSSLAPLARWRLGGCRSDRLSTAARGESERSHRLRHSACLTTRLGKSSASFMAGQPIRTTRW
jgi:hypothetical protein